MITLKGCKTGVTKTYLVVRTKTRGLEVFSRPDGDEVVLHRAEDFIDFANFIYVFRVNGGVEIWHFILDVDFDDHVIFACMLKNSKRDNLKMDK